MKWISLTYLITPLLIGCTPNDNNSDLFKPTSLKDPLEESHGLSTTAEKSFHCYLVFEASSESYFKLAKAKDNSQPILDLANDHQKIAMDFKRFYMNSKDEDEIGKSIRTKKDINILTTECMIYGQTFGYTPWS